jgi:endonuclease-3
VSPAGGGAASRAAEAALHPADAWARQLTAERPGLVRFVLDALATLYGRPRWHRRNEPTSELVLTILAQNSADTNAEAAFEELRRHYPWGHSADAANAPPPATPPNGWGGVGLRPGDPPDWAAIETAPLDELVDVIRPGGLARQKAPRIQAALARIRAERGDYSLEFLAERSPEEALAWLTSIPGIGKKTAAIVLLFCFGHPLMPVDRHVERVAKRIGLVPPRASPDDAHEIFGRLLQPHEVYEAHVNLITHGRRLCHARRPDCERCPVAPRCRFVDPAAP